MQLFRKLVVVGLIAMASIAISSLVVLEVGYRLLLRGIDLPESAQPQALAPRVASALWVGEGGTGPIRVQRRYPWNLFGLIEMLRSPQDRPQFAPDLQLANRVFLPPSPTMHRHFKELAVAAWLGRRFSADELLSLYASKVWVGDGRIGLEAGADRLFGKRLNQLDASQLALVVGLVQSPNRYDPFKHPDIALERRNRMLDRFNAEGLIDDLALTAAKAESLGVRTTPEV